jgi:hypothetical protein
MYQAENFTTDFYLLLFCIISKVNKISGAEIIPGQ